MKNKIIIKNNEQIAGIRKSCKLAAETLKFIGPYVLEGITTAELDSKIEDFIRSHGAVPAPLNYKDKEGHVYPKATCISVNEVVCHGIPGHYQLKSGDIVNIDVTTILDGYYGDTATMFAVGEISPKAERLLDVAKNCLDIGIKQVKPGNKFGKIGYAIAMYAGARNCSVVDKFCGHGCGLEFHEEPSILHIAFEDSGEVMLPGMIFTCEPMINEGNSDVLVDETDHWTARTADGKLSAQYEHMLLVTSNGVEILTKG